MNDKAVMHETINVLLLARDAYEAWGNGTVRIDAAIAALRAQLSEPAQPRMMDASDDVLSVREFLATGWGLDYALSGNRVSGALIFRALESFAASRAAPPVEPVNNKAGGECPAPKHKNKWCWQPVAEIVADASRTYGKKLTWTHGHESDFSWLFPIGTRLVTQHPDLYATPTPPQAAERVDAERYRYLRDLAGNEILNRLKEIVISDEWDAAIDAARAKGGV